MKVATLGELGELVGGKVRGALDLSIDQALPLQVALTGNCITLLDRSGTVEALVASHAVAAVVPEGFPVSDIPTIEVAQPHAAFEAIIQYLRPSHRDHHRGVHPDAHIDPTAQVGKGCSIAAGTSIGANCIIGDRVHLHSGVHIMADSQVGDDCEFYPGVVLYPNTKVGARCLIHAGTVLGAYGFGYRNVNGQHKRTAQLGWVEIADDVELGACVTIDRGTYGPTRVGTGTKIDNQVMIGHNCQIGQHNLICAQVGIAGSSSTGNYVVLAGQVGIKDHIKLADRVMIAAQSGVMHNVPAGEVWSGTPAMPGKKFMQCIASLSRLGELRSDVKRLQKDLEKAEQAIQALHYATGDSQSAPVNDSAAQDKRAA